MPNLVLSISCKNCSYLFEEINFFVCKKYNNFRIVEITSSEVRTPDWCPLAGILKDKISRYQMINK